MCEDVNCDWAIYNNSNPVYDAKMRFWGAGLHAPQDEVLTRLILIQNELRNATGRTTLDIIGYVVDAVADIGPELYGRVSVIDYES